MLLAELEVFHSRPIAPTRRVALGVAVLEPETIEDRLGRGAVLEHRGGLGRPLDHAGLLQGQCVWDLSSNRGLEYVELGPHIGIAVAQLRLGEHPSIAKLGLGAHAEQTCGLPGPSGEAVKADEFL